MVGDDRQDLSRTRRSAGSSSREFFKMSGSGNDFVIVDARVEPPGELATPPVVRAICARGTGVGADGIVFIEPSDSADFRMTYLNSDGSPAALCGNASLCVTALAAREGFASQPEFAFETGSGTLRARIVGGEPEIDLQPATDLQRSLQVAVEAGERRIGFVVVGVPHVVVECADVDQVDVMRRGSALRHSPQVGTAGSNVNFVSRLSAGRGWAIRTFERGVEGETLACGSGAVAAAALLGEWGEAGSSVQLRTRSRVMLTVRFEARGDTVTPSLSGEGRLVYRGRLESL